MTVADRKWTKEQLDAINAESGTLLVAAAAGSGKTSVLVERVVRKITQPENAVSPESILVVTFTKAAAEEMKARISARISKKIAEEPSRRTEFSKLLAKLSEMRVSTMDSFCMSLVKDNCHELDIDADLRMMETGEAADLKKKTAAEVCEERFSDSSENFIPLAELFDSGINDSSLINSIITLSDFSMSEPFPDVWLDSVADRFLPMKAQKSIWGQILLSNAEQDIIFAEELLESALSDVSEDEELEAKLRPILESDISFIDETVNSIRNDAWDVIRRSLCNALTNIKAKRFTAPKGYKDDPQKLSAAAKRDEVKKILGKHIELLCCSESENAEDVAVLRNIAKELTNTVKLYNKRLLEKKKELNLYDYPDILHFSLSLLCDPSADDKKTPLARELSEGFSEILIDEYQDTNRAQDMLFTTLSKNGNNMFMVGDVKQSIYRFRLASPEIFIEKCENYPYYDGKALKSKIILGKNFRSRKGVTDCVNFMFSSLMSKKCGDIEYNEDERLNFGAEYYPPRDGNDAEFTVLEADGEKTYKVEADYIASVIKKKLKEEKSVTERDSMRKARPGDFCILLRSPSTTASYYIASLRNAGIPVAAENLESFFDTAEIKTMMAYLRTIDNPGRDIDLLAVMFSPIFGFSPDDVTELKIKYGRRTNLYSAVVMAADAGDEKCRTLSKKISMFKKLSASYSVDVLIREIYSDSLYPVIAGAMEEGEMKRNNLRILLEYAEKKNAESSSNLCSFIRYMDMLKENGAKIESGAGSGGGVKIMSMHGSKGLEFPFVFIAGLGKKINMTDINSNLVIDHEYGLGFKRKEPENVKLYPTLSLCAVKSHLKALSLSEELRIYYVALTRAKEKLYIVAALDKSEKKITEKEYLLPESKIVPPYFVSDIIYPVDWFLMSFIHHPDAGVLRFIRPCHFKDESKMDIKYIDKRIPEDESGEDEKSPEVDSEILNEIRQKAVFKYKYAPVAYAVSKHTASTLRAEHFDPAGFAKSIPDFMFASSLSPANIGTATHLFLQFCDFSKCKSDILSEKERLVKEGRLTAKQADAIDIPAIEYFVNSEIMKRIECSEKYFREKQFTISKKVCDIEDGIPEEFADEKTIVIGKLDLLFIEKGKAVIVDYKTDDIEDVKQLKTRHSEQMKLYCEAVEKSMEIEVEECILYSLKLKKYISIKNS